MSTPAERQRLREDITDYLHAPKPWWQSRTLIGACVVLAGQAAALAGWELDQQGLTDAIVSALTLLGAALVWWGRVKATRPIRRRRDAVAPDPDSARARAQRVRADLPTDAGRGRGLDQPLGRGPL